MWITRRTDYATRAVLALALADDGRPRKIQELAEATGTPVTVLEQVLPQLRSAGIVRSERGPTGGYRLNHPPEEITLGKVVRLIQGPLAPISCATRQRARALRHGGGCALQADVGRGARRHDRDPRRDDVRRPRRALGRPLDEDQIVPRPAR